MRRALTIGGVLVIAVVAVVFAAGAGSDSSGTYKVRAIFDNASFLISGQDVKIAGAKVGVVDSLDVTPDHKAAIVLEITRSGFKDFRQDAHCEIRLQSVIGEKLVECEPTQPKEQGEPESPRLKKIPKGQPGAGQYLLPVESTTTPVDADLINNIQQRPFRERLSILLSELGVGVASRAEDIRALIRRGNPALKELDQFLRILAGQNRMLKRLTGDADRIFISLADKRRELADFFVQSGIAAEATAEKRQQLERNFAKFPPFLRELAPFMDRFAGLSSQMAPVISDLRASGPDISRLLIALGPFSTNSGKALKSLGNAADVGRPALVAALPVVKQLGTLTSRGRNVARNLRLLLTSIQSHKGIERFLDLLYNQTMSFNGFDEVGHYLRNNLIVTICSGYTITKTIGCPANFIEGSSASASSSAAATSTASISSTARQLVRLLAGPEKQQPKKTGAGTSKGDGTRTVAERTGDGGAANGAAGGEVSKPAPKAESPSTTPDSPPAAQQGQDGLLDYLLGGSR
jgi:phospholipid/cholesterol/gamma-HCH transport system substrate-binding protein